MAVFWVHTMSCAFMTGLIWTVQLLLYPAFAYVEENKFASFHERHSRVITYIVMPAMIFELLTGIALVVNSHGNVLYVVNLVLLAAIWGCTAFLSVPIHNELSRSMNAAQIQKLISTNWPRTFLWSLRLGILLASAALLL